MIRAFVQSRRRSIGFSLIELLVVIAILGLLAAVGIPAIRNMIYTSTGSMAEVQLRLALGAARDLAIRNPGGDSAAVFTFEPGGRLTIVPMVHVGRILDTKDPDQALGGTPFAGYRDVFAPTPLAEPMQLPAGWMVRGFAPAGYIFAEGNNNDVPPQFVPSNGWYYQPNGTAVGNRRMNLGTDNISNLPSRGNWVFPETAFFDPAITDQGTGQRPNNRNTFMVRFASGTGRIVGVSPDPVIVLLPRVSIDNSGGKALASVQPAWSTGLDWRRIDRTDNLVSWGRAVCDMEWPTNAAALVGCRSADAALACSVDIIALYDENKMAIGIGARSLNNVTGTIYGGAVNSVSVSSKSNEVPKAPNIDVSLWPAGTFVAGGGTEPEKAERVQMLINNYMLNALRNRDVAPVGDANFLKSFIDSDARLFTVDTYMGSVTEAK